MQLARNRSDSACPSVTRVCYRKTAEVMIMQFSRTAYSPIPLAFVGKFYPEILTGSPKQGPQRRVGEKNSHFLDLSVNISKTVRDMAKATIND